MRKLACTTRADAVAGPIVLRSSSDSSVLSDSDRLALLSEVRSSPGTTARIRIEAVTYLQPEAKPNRNHVRFTKSALRALAKSFVGAPVLRDHEQDDVRARGGTILESTLGETDGAPSVRQVLELSKPWAIEGVLDGTIDRFSIGWRSTGPVRCFACEADYTSGFFGWFPSCGHNPGDVVTLKSGREVVAQMEFTAAEGIEVSAVSVPAVAGTGIDDVRAALSEARAQHQSTSRLDLDLLRAALRGDRAVTASRTHAHTQGASAMQNLSTALGLAEEATEANLLAAIDKIKTSEEGARVALKEAQAQLSQLREQLAAQEKAGHVARVQSTLDKALAERRLGKGTAVLAHAQKLAARGDLEGLEAFLADLPPGSAGCIGEPSLAAGPDPTPTSSGLTPAEDAIRQKLGLSVEAYNASKAKTRKGE